MAPLPNASAPNGTRRAPRALVLLAVLLAAAACRGDSGAVERGPVAEAEADARRPTRPNLLLLLADDQREDTLGAFGCAHARTPNLDALARDGFRFRNAYCMGSVHGAVCQPSRAMLHTGQPYFGLDLDDLDGHRTLGELLGEAGHRTFVTGKWHSSHASLKRSFREGEAIFFGGMCDHTQVPLVDLEQGAFTRARVGDGRSSELFADAAVDFLQSLGEDDAFFCYVAFTAPHDPRDPPPELAEAHRADPPPLPPNFLPQHPFDNGWLVVRDEVLAPWPRTEAVVRRQLAEYHALIEHLDTQVGRILDALEAAGHADDTLVVFTSDHGLALGSHGLLGKQSLYEHSMKSPFLVRGPGVPAGGSSDALVYLLDVFPTLLNAAGVAPPADTYGRDLAPHWTAAPPAGRATLGLGFQDDMRAVRDDRWKLIRYPNVDRTQLFDLREDPHETRDLSRDPARAADLARLRAALETWQVEVGDPLPWTADELLPPMRDLTEVVRHPDRWQPAWIRETYFGE